MSERHPERIRPRSPIRSYTVRRQPKHTWDDSCGSRVDTARMVWKPIWEPGLLAGVYECGGPCPVEADIFNNILTRMYDSFYLQVSTVDLVNMGHHLHPLFGTA